MEMLADENTLWPRDFADQQLLKSSGEELEGYFDSGK